MPLNRLRSWAKTLLMGQRLRRQNLLSTYLLKILDNQKLVCVDVGAASGLLEHWQPIMGAGDFYLIEPGSESAKELRAKYAQHQNFHVIEEGLSSTGGTKILHVTNVPTGSSILDFNEVLVGKYVSPDYLYPTRDVEIMTSTFSKCMDQAGVAKIDLIKLDVQGAEFDILKGLDSKRLNTITAVEFEYNLHNSYIGQGSFSEIQDYLGQYGLELFDIRTARTHGLLEGRPVDASFFNVYPNSRSVSARVWEFDLVYFRKSEILIKSADRRGLKSLLAAYAIYGFYLDIVRVCKSPDISRILTDTEISNLLTCANTLHLKTSRRWYDHPSTFNNAWRKIAQICGVGPDWYRLQYSHTQLPNS
jgi:FkbM family methyltransferase